MAVFGNAADLMAGASLSPEKDEAARAFLAALGVDVDAAARRPSASGEASHLAALLKVAERMPRLFELASPLAPGFVFVGGTVDPGAYQDAATASSPVDVAGRGIDFRSAWMRCIGEAVESLSMHRWGGTRPEHTRWFVGPYEAAVGGDRAQPRVPPRETPATIPADLWHDPESAGQPVGSAGCAAGESLTTATLTGLLELIERDAAALWWVGGRKPRLVPAEVLTGGGTSALLAVLRQGSRARRTWLLDLTTDLAVPCIAAVSDDGAGRGFACGLAARTALVEAADAALLELCQMELAALLISSKVRERGEAALSPLEHRRWRRACMFDVNSCPILFGAGVAPIDAAPATGDDDARLEWVLEKLAQAEVECLAVDLTREDIGVPCVRVLAPGLQSLQSGTHTERLKDAIAVSGGGPLYTDGIDLI